MKTTFDIVRIASLGVNIILDVSTKNTMDIKTIVTEVSKHKGHITLVNCENKSTFDLCSIVQICPSQITISL